jgi:hypothetical protein
MKLDCPREIFEKSLNTKFHENPSSGSRVVACGRADGRTDGRTDMTKLTVAFHNFAKASKNTESLEVASKETGLEVNADKTQYMVMSGDKNAGRSHWMKTDNRSELY